MLLDPGTFDSHREGIMPALALLGIILIVLWAVLWLGFHVVAGVIHLLVIVGAVLLIWGLVRRGARAVTRE
jgi:hypothetical protein